MIFYLNYICVKNKLNFITEIKEERKLNLKCYKWNPISINQKSQA